MKLYTLDEITYEVEPCLNSGRIAYPGGWTYVNKGQLIVRKAGDKNARPEGISVDVFEELGYKEVKPEPKKPGKKKPKKPGK